MAIVIDIKADPSYKSPTSMSQALNTLSGDHLDYVSFVDASSYWRGSSISMFTNNSMPESLTVGGHTWCSINEVTYHVWLKDPDSKQLDVDTELSNHYASCTSPGNVGWDQMEALLLHGLGEVKKSLVSFCEMIIWLPEHDDAADPIGALPPAPPTIESVIDEPKENFNLADIRSDEESPIPRAHGDHYADDL
ncbi:hypothetical protein BS17DRAFT_815372 [Gyrodon lividus]|nr:hypothetical protein BS17DRAFT_815372 [Gyrodon lividus]